MSAPNDSAPTTSTPSIKVLIATFAEETAAARGLAVLAPGLEVGIGMAAVVVKSDEGKVRFVETHDKTAAQGAFQGAGLGAIGALVGLAFGPLALIGAPLGAGIGALIGKLRDTGFDDEELVGLGDDLAPGSSALVATIDALDVDKARRLLAEVGVVRVIVNELAGDLAKALDEIVTSPPA